MRILATLNTTALLIVLWAGSNRTSAITYRVTSDTSALVGHPSGPFSLDFQLIDGSGTGDGNTTVTIGNFDFGGGSWAGTDPGALVMTDTIFFSEIYQEFVPGSFVAFDLTLSTVLDPGGIPDAFSFAILDGSLVEIPTDGLGDALLSVDLDSPAPSVITYSSDPGRTLIVIAAPAAALSSVPEALNARWCLGAVFCLLIALPFGQSIQRPPQIRLS